METKNLRDELAMSFPEDCIPVIREGDMDAAAAMVEFSGDLSRVERPNFIRVEVPSLDQVSVCRSNDDNEELENFNRTRFKKRNSVRL